MKNKPSKSAGSLNRTVTELMTEFSICWIFGLSCEHETKIRKLNIITTALIYTLIFKNFLLPT